MFNSTTLEVAIGMAFIYLVLSLFCTAISEGIAGILGSRATNLERGLRALFSEGTLPKVDAHGVVERDSEGNPMPGKSLTDAIYDHGLVQSLYQSGAGAGISRWWGGGKRLPSYIPARTFGSVLIDLLFPEAGLASTDATPMTTLQTMVSRLNNLPEGKAKEALLAIVKQANGDLATTRHDLEGWFNDGMDRVSGWYKRKTQLILFCIGLSVAFMFNIDTINVGRALWTNPALRSYAIAAAEDYANKHPLQPDMPPGMAVKPLNQLGELALPIGWNNDGPLQWVTGKSLPRWSSGEGFCFALVGWLLTGIAMTLGAPFWFDTLNQFMVVRSTIKPREKSEVDASKDPSPR